MATNLGAHPHFKFLSCWWKIDNSDMCRTYLPDISQIYRTCWFHPPMCFKSSSFRLNRLGSPQARHEAKIWQQHRKGHVGPLEVHHLHHLSVARGPRGDYMAKIHHLDPFTSMMFAWKSLKLPFLSDFPLPCLTSSKNPVFAGWASKFLQREISAGWNEAEWGIESLVFSSGFEESIGHPDILAVWLSAGLTYPVDHQVWLGLDLVGWKWAMPPSWPTILGKKWCSQPWNVVVSA